MPYQLFGDLSLSLLARVVPGLLSFAAIPFLVSLLGAERYASVGFFQTMQMIVGLLDMGLSVAATKHAAWLTGTNASGEKFWRLLLTLERFFLIVCGGLVLVGVFSGRELLHLIFQGDLAAAGVDRVVGALLVCAIAVRFPFSLYAGYLAGRGQLNTANLIVLLSDTARVGGAILVLLLTNGSLAAFFLWHIFASLAADFAGAWASRRSIPAGELAGGPDWAVLREVEGLALSSGVLTLMFLAANTLDKVVLPRFVSAREYGLYIAVSQLALIANVIVQTVWTTMHPKLLASLAQGVNDDNRAQFQLMLSLMTGVCAAGISLCWIAGPALLPIWIWGGSLNGELSKVLTLLVVGYAAAALMMPSLTIQQTVNSVWPTVLNLAVALAAMIAVWSSILRQVDMVSVAAVWAGVYVVSFMLSGFTYVNFDRRIFVDWVGKAVAPLVLTIGVSALLSQWTDRAGSAIQIAAGFGLALACGVVSLGASVEVRRWCSIVARRLIAARVDD
ncbi:MAG: hypothetical protein ABL901_02170 [Hyphomicrobiaceae bacterium]